MGRGCCTCTRRTSHPRRATGVFPSSCPASFEPRRASCRRACATTPLSFRRPSSMPAWRQPATRLPGPGSRWPAVWPSPPGVVSEALPVDHDTGLIPDDPRVVAGWNDGEIPRAVLRLLPIVHDDLHPAGYEVTHVGGLAALGLRERLHVL